MRTLQFLFAAPLALLASCAEMRTAPQRPAPLACSSELTGYGTRAAVNADPESIAVGLREVPLTPMTIGYGPGGGYDAELTLVDGVWQIARATDRASVRVETLPADGAGAVFLVTASPQAWGKRELDAPVTGLSDLEARLADIASASDCPAGAIAFRATGTISDADWSVVGRPKGARGHIDTAEVTLVGVYDPVETDRFFMAGGRNIHVHFVTQDGSLSGHLGGFTSLDNGTLFIPQ